MDINEIRRANARYLADREKFRSHFAEKIGKSTAQVNNWIGKNPTKNIGPDNARNIERCYDKPHGWLDQIHDSTKQMVAIDTVFGYEPPGDVVLWDDPDDLPLGEFVMIDQLDMEAAAGAGRTNGSWPTLKQKLAFRTDWIKKSKPSSVQRLIVATVAGDSMMPWLQDNDSILVDTNSNKIQNGKVYVIVHDYETKVKRLYMQGDKVIIHSDNQNDPAYRYDIEVSGEALNDLHIVGEVVWRGG